MYELSPELARQRKPIGVTVDFVNEVSDPNSKRPLDVDWLAEATKTASTTDPTNNTSIPTKAS